MSIFSIAKPIHALQWEKVPDLLGIPDTKSNTSIYNTGLTTNCYLIFLPLEKILSTPLQGWSKIKQSLPLGPGYLILPKNSSETRRSPHKAIIYRPNYPYIPLLPTSYETLEKDWQSISKEEMAICLTIQSEDRYTALSKERWGKIKIDLTSMNDIKMGISYPYPGGFLNFCTGILKDKYNLSHANRINIIFTLPLYELFIEEEINNLQLTTSKYPSCSVSIFTTPFILDLNFFPVINEYTSIIIIERD